MTFLEQITDTRPEVVDALHELVNISNRIKVLEEQLNLLRREQRKAAEKLEQLQGGSK